MAAPKVIFRSDASPEIGGGHVVRCMALAHAFRAAGAEVRFCISDSTPATVREIERDFPGYITGFGVEPSGAERLASAFGGPADVLVVDHYGIGIEYERTARRFARALVAIDDFPSRPHAATHVVDTTLGRRAEDYAPVTEPGTTVMCGSAYAMLRPAFRKLRPAKPRKGPIRHLLVTFGMTDFADVSGLAAAALAELPGDIAATFVIGGSAPFLPTLREKIAASGRDWRLVIDADSERMATLTAEADLVIGAPGSASYERCCLGKPTLLVQFADNQVAITAAAVAAGAARLIGIVPQVTAADISRAVAELIRAPQEVHRMAEAALAVTDGRGVERIVATVLGRAEA